MLQTAELPSLQVQIEQQWANEEDEMEDGLPLAMMASKSEQMTAAEESSDSSVDGIDGAYVQMFLMRYLCPQEDCGGTLAPIYGTDLQECNRCSHRRSNADFLASLDSLQEGND